MEQIKNFLTKALSSKSEVSSKRLIAFLAFIMMCTGFISNLYFGFKVEEHMFKSMEWVVEIGMGAVLLEPLTRKKEDSKDDTKPTTSGDTQNQIAVSGDTQSPDMPTGPDPTEWKKDSIESFLISSP